MKVFNPVIWDIRSKVILQVFICHVSRKKQNTQSLYIFRKFDFPLEESIKGCQPSHHGRRRLPKMSKWYINLSSTVHTQKSRGKGWPWLVLTLPPLLWLSWPADSRDLSERELNPYLGALTSLMGPCLDLSGRSIKQLRKLPESISEPESNAQ